jgi:hypothetical protein
MFLSCFFFSLPSAVNEGVLILRAQNRWCYALLHEFCRIHMCTKAHRHARTHTKRNFEEEKLVESIVALLSLVLLFSAVAVSVGDVNPT